MNESKFHTFLCEYTDWGPQNSLVPRHLKLSLSHGTGHDESSAKTHSCVYWKLLREVLDSSHFFNLKIINILMQVFGIQEEAGRGKKRN